MNRLIYNMPPTVLMNIHRLSPGSELIWTKNGHPCLQRKTDAQVVRMICRKRDGRWNYRVFIDNQPIDTTDFWKVVALLTNPGETA